MDTPRYSAEDLVFSNLPKDTQDPGREHMAIRSLPFCTSCLLHPQPGALTLVYLWKMQTISRGCPGTTLPTAAFLNYLPPAATLGVPKTIYIPPPQRVWWHSFKKVRSNACSLHKAISALVC